MFMNYIKTGAVLLAFVVAFGMIIRAEAADPSLVILYTGNTNGQLDACD
jgi:hypothetical protein